MREECPSHRVIYSFKKNGCTDVVRLELYKIIQSDTHSENLKPECNLSKLFSYLDTRDLVSLGESDDECNCNDPSKERHRENRGLFANDDATAAR